MNIEPFKQILLEESIKKVAATVGAEDERERKLPICEFFWLMILAAGESETTGCMSKLCSQYATASIKSFPEDKPTTITKATISKKALKVDWKMFKKIFHKLLKKYRSEVPKTTWKNLKEVSSIKIPDGSTIQICKKLEKLFPSTKKGIATIKLHMRYSLAEEVVDKIVLTPGKRHDKTVPFQEAAKHILYLFDLGYYSYSLFNQIIQRDCYFVSRLKTSSKPLVLKPLDRRTPKEVKDLSLKEICEKAKNDTVDLLVNLGTTEQNKMENNVRLVGIKHNGEWYFYLTNLFSRELKPYDIYLLYTQRWQIEIFFNQIKTYLKLSNIFFQSKNGILIQIYAGLIYFLLNKILTALAAQQAERELCSFSFKTVAEQVGSYLKSISSLLCHRIKNNFTKIWEDLVLLISYIPKRVYQPKSVFT